MTLNNSNASAENASEDECAVGYEAQLLSVASNGPANVSVTTQLLRLIINQHLFFRISQQHPLF